MSNTRAIKSSAFYTLKSLSLSSYVCTSCRHARTYPRRFTTTARQAQEQRDRNGPFTSRLRAAFGKTKTEWKPIPIGLGVAFLGAAQFYRIQRRERRRQEQEEQEARRDAEDRNSLTGAERRPPKRKRVRPSGPWSDQYPGAAEGYPDKCVGRSKSCLPYR